MPSTRKPCYVTLSLLLSGLLSGLKADDAPSNPFPIRSGDRVAWIGSSSTGIGIWPATMNYLLRTRHPELKLTLSRHSTGGGTFVTGYDHLPMWLAESKPTLVFFNYGSNDAAADRKGLPQFRDNLRSCVARAEASGARVVLMTPQAADARKATQPAADRRKLYADEMLRLGVEEKRPVIDIHTPLDELQRAAQADDDSFTILKDNIHLTDAGYVAWGYFLYEAIHPPIRESLVRIDVSAASASGTGAVVEDLKIAANSVSFVRRDGILPLLPPIDLPPHKLVPLERFSLYRLEVRGLAAGRWKIRVEGKEVGIVSEDGLAAGVNLNSLLLEAGRANAAPWHELSLAWWNGKRLDEIGKTAWKYELTRE